MARRKTLKKTEYGILSNCFDALDKPDKGWSNYFSNPNPIVLELGCGKAEFSYHLAKKYPEKNFIGVDLKMDRMWRPAREAIAEGITNLAFLRTHLLHLSRFFLPGQADEIWITFPDPYPKAKQAKHRMLNPAFLLEYQQVIKPGGKLYFKTDNLPLFQYCLVLFVRLGTIRLHELTFDLHGEEQLPEDWKIMTSYERRFRAQGIKINLMCFSFEGEIKKTDLNLLPGLSAWNFEDSGPDLSDTPDYTP